MLKDETGFAGKEIEREMLNTIIHCRVREAFELLKKQLEDENHLPFLGAGMMLTGGCRNCSKASIIWPRKSSACPSISPTRKPWCRTRLRPLKIRNFSTAIGLIKYAEAMQPERPTGLFGRIRKKFSIFGLW